MGNVRRFAAINAKVNALKGRLLKKDAYYNLLGKKDVKAIAEFLKGNTAYREVFKDIDIRFIHRGDLELLLKRYVVNIFEKLMHYFTDDYRKLFRVIFVRFEIEDLKLYLRAITRSEDLGYVKELVLYSGLYSTVDHEVLSKSKTLELFIENLKGTMYYQALKPFLNERGIKQTFYMEMNLDRLYFRQLYEQADKLSLWDEKILKDLLGKNIDLLNLEWIYRGLKFYEVSPEELINYTLMGGYELNFRRIKELCYSKSDDELKERMVDTRYGFLFDNEKTIDLFMERRIERYLYFQFLELYRKGKMDISKSIAYIHLLEYEIRDIISITEGIRYGLDERETKQYLIRRIEGSEV